MTRLVVMTMIVILCGRSAHAGPQVPARGDPAQTDTADRLYAGREDLSSARAAADIWAARLAADAADFEAGWKLARACYWIGGHVPSEERHAHYTRGIDAGRKAVAAGGLRPEGHFWLGAVMGAMAEASGLRTGLRYRGAIRRELEAALSIAPAYDYGAPDRAISRWYLKVPPLFGGSKDRSLQHLQRSLTYDPTNAATHYFLAETYVTMNRPGDARRSFQRVLEAPLLADWAPEVREFQSRARRRLTPPGP